VVPQHHVPPFFFAVSFQQNAVDRKERKEAKKTMSRLGDSRLQFGVDDEVWGYVQNMKQDESSQKVAAPNGSGNTVAVEFFNVGEKKVTGSYFYLTDQTGGPLNLVGSATGCTITDVTGTIYIDRAGRTRTSGNWSVIDFEGTHYPHLVLS
jgi:hypothetical protein